MAPSVDSPVSRDPLSLNSNEWGAVLPTVLRHARKRLRSGCLEGARDLAQEAAVQACEGRLAKTGVVGVQEATFLLCGAVNGLAMNERRRWHNTREVAVDAEDLASFGGGTTPEDAVIARQEHALFAKALRARFSRDAVGARIVELLERGVYDPAGQAAAARLPIEDIRKGRRRVLAFIASRTVAQGTETLEE